MPRWSLFLGFFIFALLVLGGVHYYFYRRLVVAPELPSPWRTIGLIAAILLTLSFPASFVIGRVMAVGTARYLLFPIYIWVGTMLILFFVLLGVDILRGLFWLGTRLSGAEDIFRDPGRRLFFARTLAGAASAAVLAASGIGVWRGLGRPVIKRLEITLPKLPAALDGFTIAQLTDLHLGAMRGGQWLREVVDRTNALTPDLIAITGDLADATPSQLPEEVAMIGELHAPHGTYFVTGNHEYFYDLEAWLRQLDDSGIRVLRNERVPIARDGAGFDLAGVDDHEGSRLAPGHGPDVAGAMRNRDPDRAVVLLAHQPRAAEEASQHGVGLVLSGHTHGGQIWPWGYFVYLQQPYVSGLHDHRGTQIYVSEGTGFWGPPMRLGSSSEITLVTLRAPSA